MKTIYVVQNGDEEPMMAFFDRQTAEYVARTSYAASPTVYGAPLMEYDCATDKMMEELKGDN